MQQITKLKRILYLHPEFSEQQELVHSYLHAMGTLFGLVAIPILLAFAAGSHNEQNLVSCSLYSFGFIMTFTCSALYHGTRRAGVKRIFKTLDYISIYFMIAGTYTPLIVNYMFNERGILLLGIVWLLALLGMLSKIFLPRTQGLISVAFYLFIGLLFLFVREPFFLLMPLNVSILTISGVVLYCIGLVFFLWKKWMHHHAAWHLLVLCAGLCHFAAILITIEG